MNTIIKNKYLFPVLLAIPLLLAACRKEDPFTGKDNYIVSFSLKQDATTLHAEISDHVITIKAPDGFSLDKAAATVILSENASIYPDPASVTNWNEEMIFAVTARNGTQVQYKYTVVRNSIDSKGTVVLETQADVDAFEEKGITAIAGSLIIGRTAGKDSITSLAPLAGLGQIAYSLTVYPTYSGTDLSGLDKLEKVGGDIRMDGLANLAEVSFPGLVTAGDIYIKNTSTGSAAFPQLTAVSKTLTLDCPLTELSFPNLKTVGEKVTLNTASNSNAMLARISFPSLEETGGTYFTYFKSVTKIDMPELRRVGDMNFNQLVMLSAIIVPKLEVSTGTISIPSVTYLTEVSFPALTQVATLAIDSKAIRVLDFPRLKTVTNSMAIRSAQVNGIAGFKSLENVEGELMMYELAQMTSLRFPSSLQHIGKLSIDRRTTPVMDEINVKGLNVGELKIMANAILSKIVGDDIFHGTLTISSSGATYTNGYPGFPELEGFREVDSLSLDGYVSVMDTVHIRSIKKINKGFRLENNNIKRFSMPDLVEIGGDFYFARLDQGVDETLDFENLERVNGDLDIAVGSQVTRTLRMDKLQTITGNFILKTGYGTGRDLKTVSFPSLKTIGGGLSVQGTAAATVNQILTNLDGFAALSNVRSIQVTNQKAIVSYAGLKEAVKSINASGWNATGNNYNPTYEDLLNDLWIKP